MADSMRVQGSAQSGASRPVGRPGRRRPSFGVTCVAAALITIAANMIHPVEPAFYLSLHLPDWVFGAAYAAMALGMFLFSPFWGRVSDRLGRVPVLGAVSLLYGASQLSFGFSTSIPAIMASRFASGLFYAGVNVGLMAYVADISDECTVGRRMSVYGAVVSSTTALGYLVGGFIGVDDPVLSFLWQFAVLAAASVLIFACLAEGSRFERSRDPLTPAQANPLAAFAGAREVLTPWMALFLAAAFFACGATSDYNNAFNYYLRDQFGFPTTYNGVIYAVVGVVGFAVNLTLGLRLQRGRDVQRSLAVVLALCAGSLLAALPVARAIGPFVGVNLVFCVFNTMYLPLMQALAVSKSRAGHGAVSGMFNSMRSLGMMAGGLSAGLVYDLSAPGPFAMGAAAFALSCLLTFFARRLSRGREGREGQA